MIKKRIIYQVLVRAWKDGRFSCWDDSAFRYLGTLGITDIWFTGIPRHASGRDFVKGNLGSPYAVSDWYDVNPYLADNPETRMDEFESLVRRCHKAGFRVITDFIPNHVACDYSDRFGGIPVCDHCDYDWTDTRKIDYSHPEALAAMTRIAQFWASKGVDGLRCDMVEMVSPDILASITASVRRDYPEFCFIGEAYDRANYERYISAGFDLLYDKTGLYDSLRAICCNGESAERITWNWQNLGPLQASMLNFLENHDERRLASSGFLGDARKSFAALAVSALFGPASFMIYGGQECGENAEDGNDGRTSIFDGTRIKSLDNPDAAVLEKYRTLMKTASSPLCMDGSNYDLCYCNVGAPGFDRTRHFAFLRHLAGRTAVCLCNFSGNPASVDIMIPEDAARSFNTECRSVHLEAGPYDYIFSELK